MPALALGLEKKEPGIMKRKPRSKDSGIYADGMFFDLIYQGIVIASLILLSYFIGVLIDTGMWQVTYSERGISMAFLTMSMVGCFHAVNLRSRRQSLFALKNRNWILMASVAVALILTTIVCEVDPIAAAFKLTRLEPVEWFISLGLGFAIIPIVELVKFFQRT